MHIANGICCSNWGQAGRGFHIWKIDRGFFEFFKNFVHLLSPLSVGRRRLLEAARGRPRPPEVAKPRLSHQLARRDLDEDVRGGPGDELVSGPPAPLIVQGNALHLGSDELRGRRGHG